ncbi:hypothetical protein [Acinetobacter pittii]|uniref:hypothetical protein n=1 Tax=Acinetobacter pittii TaxID=48296 RepID=UPI00300A6363
MTQENTTEENLQLTEAKIVTLINQMKTNKDILSEESDRIFQIIRSSFPRVRKYIEERKNLYGENLKFSIYIYDNILNKLKIIHDNNSDSLVLDPIQESHYFEIHIWDEFANIEYEVRNNLSNYEFEFIWDEISNNILNLNDYSNKKLYNDISQNDKENLSKTLINLRNNLSINTNRNDELKNSNRNNYLKILESFNELNKLKSQVEEIKDSHEILTKIKENKAIENTYELQNGYQDEVNNAAKEIKNLNRIIILLFSGIAAIITTKIILIVFLQDLFNDIYNFLTYLSLLVTLSAITTYLIKERNRIIRLHDYFNLTMLELKTLPQYMRELDSTQRKNLIINLSPNFFKGSTKITSIQEQDQNISNADLTNIVSNTIKFLNEQKK